MKPVSINLFYKETVFVKQILTFQRWNKWTITWTTVYMQYLHQWLQVHLTTGVVGGNQTFSESFQIWHCKKDKLLPQNRLSFQTHKWATNWAKEEPGQKMKNRDSEYSFPKLATISPVKTGSLQWLPSLVLIMNSLGHGKEKQHTPPHWLLTAPLQTLFPD